MKKAIELARLVQQWREQLMTDHNRLRAVREELKRLKDSTVGR